MKELLTVRIVLALDNDFVQYLLLQLKNEKRQTLLLLIKTILIQKEEMDKQAIFKKIFLKNWTKENDYLLRNELKLLKDKIEDYYIKYSTAYYLQPLEDKILLDFYKKIRVSDEYFSLNKKYVNKKRNELDFNSLVENNFSHADFVRINVPNYQERAALLEENLKDTQQNILNLYTQHIVKSNTLNAHFQLQQKQLNNINNNVIYSYNDSYITKDLFVNNLNNYFLAYANAYVNFDTSTIEQWEDVYQKLLNVPKDYRHYEQELCLTLSMLATVCSIRNLYEKSEHYFTLLFDSISINIINKNISIYLNYITNLNKLKKYEKATQQLQYAKNAFGDMITKTPQYRTQELVAAIYLNDVAKIKKIMTIDFENLQAFERIFYRLFYCIYFIIDQQYELAQTEIQNLQRSKLINEIDNFAKIVADYFYVCIRNMNLVSDTKIKLNNKQKQEILQIEEKIKESNLPLLLNYAPYLWMKEKIRIYFP